MRCWLTAVAMASCLQAAAQEGAKPTPTPAEPVNIRSDQLVVDQKKQRALFSGNVRAVQGELVIRCDRLAVHYAGGEDPPEKTRQITSMVFTGSVSIEQKQRQGHCDRAEYHRPARRIICTGNPWVVEGENRIQGRRIEYLLDRDEVRVLEPRAVIRLPEGSRKPGNQKP